MMSVAAATASQNLVTVAPHGKNRFQLTGSDLVTHATQKISPGGFFYGDPSEKLEFGFRTDDSETLSHFTAQYDPSDLLKINLTVANQPVGQLTSDLPQRHSQIVVYDHHSKAIATGTYQNQQGNDYFSLVSTTGEVLGEIKWVHSTKNKARHAKIADYQTDRLYSFILYTVAIYDLRATAPTKVSAKNKLQWNQPAASTNFWAIFLGRGFFLAKKRFF